MKTRPRKAPDALRQQREELIALRHELIDAVRANDRARIEAALLTPAARVVDSQGSTALMEAIGFGFGASLDSLRLLLAGSDPRAQDRRGRTALMLAIRGEEVVNIEALMGTPIGPRGEVDRRDAGKAAPAPAVPASQSDIVSLLVAASDANARNKAGETALMRAVIAANAQVVPALITASDPKAVDNRGWSALMHAALSNAAECVRLLLPVSDAKAISTRPAAKNLGAGWSALMIAASCGQLESVELLLPVSDAKLRDPQGDTALSLATERWHARCADRLAEFSERSEADRALAKFGAAHMPRWVECLARRESEALAEEIGLDDARDDYRGDEHEGEGAQTAPAARAKPMRL